jgi:hypothetical protein
MPARTDEQLDKIIGRRFTTSYMSNAKWRKFFTILGVAELHITQAIWKFVDSDTEVRGWFAKPDQLMEKYVGDYGLGPFAYKRIEWIEIPWKGIPPGFEKVPFKHWDQNVKDAEKILRYAGMFEIEYTDRGLRAYGHR